MALHCSLVEPIRLFALRLPSLFGSGSSFFPVKTLGPDGLQNVGPDIIGALPTGNQKSALFKIFSTE